MSANAATPLPLSCRVKVRAGKYLVASSAGHPVTGENESGSNGSACQFFVAWPARALCQRRQSMTARYYTCFPRTWPRHDAICADRSPARASQPGIIFALPHYSEREAPSL